MDSNVGRGCELYRDACSVAHMGRVISCNVVARPKAEIFQLPRLCQPQPREAKRPIFSHQSKRLTPGAVLFLARHTEVCIASFVIADVDPSDIDSRDVDSSDVDLSDVDPFAITDLDRQTQGRKIRSNVPGDTSLVPYP